MPLSLKTEHKELLKFTISDGKAKEILTELLNLYLTPSFGNIKQKEIDLFVFSKLIEIGFLKEDVFDIISKLKVTRQKARNLLYEYNLRKSSDMSEEYKKFLTNPILEKDKEIVIFNIENPLLIDYIKSKLKEKNLLSDGSFSPEIIKLRQQVYIELLKECITDREDLIEQLKQIGINDSLDELIKNILKKASIKVFNNSNDFVVDEYISPFINNNITNMIEIFKKSNDEVK